MPLTGLYLGDTFAEPHRYTVINTYVCPSWPHELVYRNDSNTFRNGAITNYQGIGGVWRSGEPMTYGSTGGDMPKNGLFGYDLLRRLRDVQDGLSQTLAIGEFVQIDVIPGSGTSDFSTAPGNVRSWILGSANNGTRGAYGCKAIKDSPLNALVNRTADGVMFNHLPFGSHHPGGGNFVIGDGSVRFLSEEIDFELYKNLATCNGGELAHLP